MKFIFVNELRNVLNDLHEQKSMLLYLETCIVDNMGFARARNMNGDDIVIANKWNDEGFIIFKRVPYDYLPIASSTKENTHYVRFSDDAWQIAHALRRQRGDKMITYHPIEKIESYRRKR